MGIKFKKQTNGNVIITDSSDNIIKIFPPKTYAHLDIKNPVSERIILSADPSDSLTSEDTFVFKRADVLEPVSASIQELISLMNTNFFFTPHSDTFLSIANGDFPDKIIFAILGNNDSASTTLTTIWPEDSIYTTPSVSDTTTIESSDSNDTTAGTGAINVLVEGLIDGYIENSEVVTLNGITPVTLASNYLAINRTTVISAGSVGSNVGVIRTKIGSNVVNHIRVGDNISDGCHYVVPVGKKLIIYFPSSAVEAGKDVDIYGRFRNSENGLLITRKLFPNYDNSVLANINIPILTLPEKSFVELLSINNSGGNANISANVIVILQDA